MSEVWFRALKARDEEVLQQLSGKAVEGAIKGVEAWLRLFTAWYNWVRPHQTLHRPSSQRGLS